MTPHLLDTVTLAGPGWNPIDDVRQILALHFMVNAVRAGTVAAVLGAVVGWFMVLRRQSFVGHTLAVVSFPGAAAAIWLGVSATRRLLRREYRRRPGHRPGSPHPGGPGRAARSRR